ncbi:MAG: hypothetical protein QG673_162, partial [Pseudomonadota bacterium]|nr:hypothetical protein [Pseudomonadota bacterium]
CYGGKLIIPSYLQTRDFELFYNLCANERVTVLNQTPTAFYQFMQTVLSKGNFNSLPDLRYVIFGGEAINLTQLKPWFKTYGYNKPQLINMYGITETTVHTTYKPITAEDINNNSLIGVTIPDQFAYVLDNNLQPLPIGAIGELYIGGIGLARGYLNLPQLTKERFIHNPFQTDEEKLNNVNDKLYKTGDLVRYLSDRTLEYIGRNDFQVKIRGFRIELSEIEVAINNSHPDIQQAIVLVYEKSTQDKSKYLVAYYVSKHKLDEITIHQKLSDMLPDYMLPNVLLWLERLPLTINGKLDRAALPKPQLRTDNCYVMPVNEIERTLCQIWQNVLEIEQVGTQDDFFKIGGDSIISIRLVAKMKAIGINVSTRDIFIHRTIKNILDCCDIAEIISNVEYIRFSLVGDAEKIIAVNRFNPNQIEDIYPASYLQMGMVLEYEKNNSNYHIVTTHIINQIFNVELFTQIFNGLINKHALLRTAIIHDKTYGFINVQYKSINVTDKLHVVDNTIIDKLITDELNHKINPENPGMFRIVIKPQENWFTLILTTHHAIEDGWSVASLIAEFITAYCNKSSPQKCIIPSYAKFISSEQQVLNNIKFKEFWLNYLNNYEPDNRQKLIFDYTLPKPIEQFEVIQNLDNTVSLQTLALANKLNISPDLIFLSVYTLVLSRFLNRNDLVVGVVVNNRLEEPGGDKLFGLHLNTIPVRFNIDNDSFNNVDNYISRVGANKLAVDEYKLYPYGKIKSDMGMHEDIYQCAFNYTNFHIVGDIYDTGLIKSSDSNANVNIPLVLNISRTYDKFAIHINANSEFIDKNTAHQLLDYFRTYLCDTLENNSVNLLPKKDYNKIIHVWNNTDKAYLNNKTIHQLFEEQVQKTPNDIAVVYENQNISYAELNIKANQLAHYLSSTYKIAKDDLIALYTNRSLYMIIAMLGALKAGAAYVPIDPDYPHERFLHILKDSLPKAILTQNEYQSKLIKSTSEINSRYPLDILALDNEEFCAACLSSQPVYNPQIYTASNSLAYVIYTSGTTGVPKGVMIEHKSVVNLVQYIIPRHQLNLYNNVLFYSNYVFDASVYEIFPALLNGNQLFIANEVIRHDLGQLIEYINLNQISVLFLPSVLVPEFVNQYNGTSVKVLFTGGDSLQNLPKYNLNYSIINEYGPTENTVCTTTYDVKNNVLIGKVIDNGKCYILDNNQQPLPVGAIGELYVGGAGLARGYLNLPDLTEEKFIPNPFQTELEKLHKINERLYCTGDLVRYRFDGNIEYIRRNDFQVKINGLRIELGEIENTLLSYRSIRQAVVVVHEYNSGDSADSVKSLIAYYVADSRQDEDGIVNYLADKLPEYMLPRHLIYLSSLPVTNNGKLDRGALPKPTSDQSTEYVEPKNDLEIMLCNAYTQVLRLKTGKVGVTNDFFKLGGNSILAIKLISQLNLQLQLKLKVVDLFVSKTVAKLAEIIGQQQQLATQICVKLNDAKNCPNMFMIHPGTGGCEVYTALAKDLEHKFICYGIDSYNIYSVNKIDNLSQLAAYYLAQIDKVMHQTNQQEYILLGWSLGGQIGAEIAAILEARGETKIKLILLDTYFTSPNEDSDMHTKTSVNNDIQWLQSYLLNTYDLQYAQSVIANMPIQDKLANTQISRKLKHTEIYLFKAMMPYRSESGNLIQISNNNHVDLICLKHNLISTVMLEYAHHFNILADKQILNYICNIPCVY